MKKAKIPADLDAVLNELEKLELRSKPIEMSQDGWNEFSLKATNVRNFILQYQEYLAAKLGGYDDKAREIAGNLADSPSRLIPRSELLTKAYEPKKPKPQQLESSNSEGTKGNAIVLNLTSGGKACINTGAPLEKQELLEAIARLKKETPNLAVVIRGGNNQRYQEMMDVMGRRVDLPFSLNSR